MYGGYINACIFLLSVLSFPSVLNSCFHDIIVRVSLDFVFFNLHLEHDDDQVLF